MSDTVERATPTSNVSWIKRGEGSNGPIHWELQGSYLASNSCTLLGAGCSLGQSLHLALPQARQQLGALGMGALLGHVEFQEGEASGPPRHDQIEPGRSSATISRTLLFTSHFNPNSIIYTVYLYSVLIWLGPNLTHIKSDTYPIPFYPPWIAFLQHLFLARFSVERSSGVPL